MEAARDRRQWRLTEMQRLFLALAVAVAIFLSAMSLGMRSFGLLLVALLLLVVVGLGVFLLGLWYSGRRVVQTGVALVETRSAPPAGQIVGRLDMRVKVDLASGGSKSIRVRDRSVELAKWPRPGAVLPIEVYERNPRSLRVLWDKVPTNQTRVAEEVYVAPFHTDYVPDADVRPPTPGDAKLIEPVTPAFDPAVGREATVPELIVPVPVPDPAKVREEAVAPPLPSRPIPTPRPAEPDRARSGDGARPGAGMLLVVSDLARSVAFYRDLLGFQVVESRPQGVILSYGGARVVLRPHAGLLRVDRRAVYVYVEVPDIHAAYRDLQAKGVQFDQKPRELDRFRSSWARFRDPDGHGLALTQWTARPELPRRAEVQRPARPSREDAAPDVENVDPRESKEDTDHGQGRMEQEPTGDERGLRDEPGQPGPWTAQ
jgi:catechol 2,3-dioxygenase-like lactoylglutathione lyase family enzyme